MTARKLLSETLNSHISPITVTDGCNREVYVEVSEEEFIKAVNQMSNSFMTLIGLFCAEKFLHRNGFTIFYVFEKKGQKGTIILERKVTDEKTTSIDEIYPTACWYEREVTDGFGIKFEGSFDKRRLFLHEIYPHNFHPLLKSFKNRKINYFEHVSKEDEYQFKQIYGEEVYQIPVGPVHAGIIEPGHFRFSVIGETIFNLEVRMFYKHRGFEKMTEGKKPSESLPLVESVSGDETVANTVGFCNAVEKISAINVPSRAWHLRTVLLEMERIYSHLGDMSGMIIDVAYPAGASPYFILREEILRQNKMLTGSRFLKGIICIGGLKNDIEDKYLRNLTHYLSGFKKRFDEASEAVLSNPSVIDRMEKTGIVKKELILLLNLTGPTAKAAGGNFDERSDNPYGLYEGIKRQIGTQEVGDVMARFTIKYQEIHDSIRIVHKMIDDMRKGDVKANDAICDGYALSLIEAPRGQNMHWVWIRDGVIERYKIRTASFNNWQAIEHAVIGNIVPDFPLINKSLNLSYAGTDL